MRSTSLIRDAAKWGMVGAGGFITGYYLDPHAGKSRRILLKDQINKLGRSILHQGSLTLKDIEHRTQGSLHEIAARFKEHDADDRIIHDRVRAVIGHFCSHPSAVQVEVDDSLVTLRGDIYKKQMRPLILAVKSVRGVKKVQNELTPHTSDEKVPNLQGSGRRPVYSAIDRQYWPPAYRLGMGIVGGVLGTMSLKSNGIPGKIIGGLGALLITRAIANKSIRHIFGVGTGPDVISIQKAININAPVDKVYDIWSHPERFPTFMRNVHNVERLPDGKFHWVVRGPAGIEVSWTSEIISREPKKRLAWQTVPGSIIEHMGRIYFEDHGKTTTVHVQMSYNPPAGALGHLVASLFRADPKKDLNEDLIRMKSMLETGRRPHDAYDKSA